LEEVVGVAIFKAEVETWAKRIGVHPREIRLRPMMRKWASCSTKGRVTFNTDLLRQPARFRAEAIVHELLHLKVPNHGKLFRALLRTHLSNLGKQSNDSRARGGSSREATRLPG
jgi:predicted metal-dependent hydrolase